MATEVGTSVFLVVVHFFELSIDHVVGVAGIACGFSRSFARAFRNGACLRI